MESSRKRKKKKVEKESWRKKERERFQNKVQKEKVEKKRGGWRYEWVYVCGEKKMVWMKERNNIKNKKLQFRNTTTIFSQ